MAGYQSVNKAARDLVPEQRTVRIIVRALQCQRTGKIEKGLIAARQALNQLRLKRRIFRGCERELAGIDRDKNGVDAFLGIGNGVDSGGTERPCRRLVPKRATGHVAFNAHLRHKADQVLSGCHTEMCAASEPHAKDGEAAFTWRAAGSQRRWRASILCARRSSLVPTIMFVLSAHSGAGRTDRINAFVDSRASNDDAKLFCKGRNVIITLPGGDCLK
jgi:hypothetical protein